MSGMMLLSAISLAATLDVDLQVHLVPDPGAGPHEEVSSARAGPTMAPNGRYPASERGFTCVVNDEVLHVEFEGNTGAWPSPMPATARCVVGPDDVVIHTVEADDRWAEQTGSSTSRAGTVAVRRHESEEVLRTWILPVGVAWRPGSHRAPLRGVRCIVDPTDPQRMQLWTPSESEFGTGTCTIRSEGRARYVLTITQERLE